MFLNQGYFRITALGAWESGVPAAHMSAFASFSYMPARLAPARRWSRYYAAPSGKIPCQPLQISVTESHLHARGGMPRPTSLAAYFGLGRPPREIHR